MVEIPSVPIGGIVTSKAPTSSIGAGDIESPYRQLASNLDKAGEVAGELSVKLARKEGEAAVSADGQIAQPAIPILGHGSAEFARAARFAALSKMTPEIENRMMEMRLAHPNDPQGFKAAADEYTKELAAKQSDPALRGPVERTALNSASSNYRASLMQADSTNVQNLLATSQKRLIDVNDQSTALARQGLVNTPEYAALAQTRDTIYRELAADARTGFTPERAQLEINENRDRDLTQAAIGHVVRESSTEAEARKSLDAVFWGPGSEKLRLTPQKRDAAINEGVAAFNNRNAEDTAETAALRSTVGDYASTIQKTPRAYDDIVHNQLVAQATARSDQKSLSVLAAVKTMTPMWTAISSLPVAERTTALAQMSRGIVPTNASSDAMQFFVERGYTREQASGIVGNLLHESALNPSAVGDAGISHGIAQWNHERLVALKQFAAAKGTSPGDFRTQLEFVDHELKTSESGALQALRAARTPQDAATAFIGFERPLGWSTAAPQAGHGYANRVANAVALAGGDASGIKPGSTVFAANPYVQRLFFTTVAQLREQQGTTAEKIGADLTDRAAKGQQPAPGQVEDFVSAATSANRPDLIEKLRPVFLASVSYDEKFRRGEVIASEEGDNWKPPPSVAAVEALAKATAAGGASVLERDTFNNLVSFVKGGEERLAKDPIGEAASRGWVRPIGALSTDNPQAAAAELADRQRKITVVQQRNRTIGGVKAIGDDEAESIRTALTQGDPALTTGFVRALAGTLTDGNYAATISSKPVAETIVGLINSQNGTRMAAGMAAADKLWRIDPAAAEGAFKSAIDKLHVWQGLKDSFTNDEIAKNINSAKDPALVKVREENRKAGLDETSSVTPGDMAYKLGTSWGIPIVSRVANLVTGATPAVSFDPNAASSLVYDYRQTYAALRADGVPADKADDLAVKRLRSSWGVSAAAGNQLMKNPPENSPAYPAIGGSKDWIESDLKAWVVKKAGPEFAAGRRSLEGGMALAGQERNWRIAGLLADDRTQAEINSGRPPSYAVAIWKADGTLAVFGASRNANDPRIAFDPSNHIAKYSAQLQSDFNRVGLNRWAHAGDKPSFLFGEGLPQ